MATAGYSRQRRERAPKPLSVPLWAMVIGVALVLLGLADRAIFDVAGLGLLFFFWGLCSVSALLLIRRRKARAAGLSR